MPQYTLTNGEKKVIFQTMAHIGSQQFYNSVRQDIIEAKNQDFTLIFEGVRPWKKENMEKFERILWMNFNENTYDIFWELYGILPQDNSLLLSLDESQEKNIDLDLDTIIELYEKNHFIIPEYSGSSSILNPEEILLPYIKSLTPIQKIVLQYCNKAHLNFFIKQDELQEYIGGNPEYENLFSIILDERNKYVAEFIQKSELQKMFVIYGMLHFEGIYSLLKETDPRWNIIDVKYIPLISEVPSEKDTPSQHREKKDTTPE